MNYYKNLFSIIKINLKFRKEELLQELFLNHGLFKEIYKKMIVSDYITRGVIYIHKVNPKSHKSHINEPRTWTYVNI